MMVAWRESGLVLPVQSRAAVPGLPGRGALAAIAASAVSGLVVIRPKRPTCFAGPASAPDRARPRPGSRRRFYAPAALDPQRLRWVGQGRWRQRLAQVATDPARRPPVPPRAGSLEVLAAWTTMIMASASGNPVSAISRLVAADEDTVRDVIHAFNERGWL